MMENTSKDIFAPSSSINYLDVARRRRWWVLGSLVTGWALAFGVAAVIPPTYTSHAVVLVSHAAIPSSYVELNVKADLTEWLRNICQRDLDRAHLEKIIEEYHLYPKLRAGTDYDLAVQRMQRDIDIAPLPADDAASPEQSSTEDPAQAARRALVPQNGKTPDSIAFRLSYTAPNRIVAQQVATELLSLMMEENMQNRQNQSQSTTNFLQTQAAQVLDQMNLQQQKIQQFKTQYMGELPDQKETNSQALTQLQSRLQSANDALARAEQQKVYLQSQAAQYKELQAGIVSDTKSTPANSPEAIDQQLDKLQKQLDDLRARYTDDYPDVRTLQKEIARLKESKTSLAAAVKTPQKPAANDPPTSLQPKTYTELQALTPILQIQSQIKSNEAEFANRQKEVHDIGIEMSHYQKLLDDTPLREQELQGLTQGYDGLKTTYDSLATKSSQSQLATNLEKRAEGEDWAILNPPNAPRKPSFPNKFIFSLAGLGGGLFLGIGLVILKEFTDERLFDEQAVKSLIPRDVPLLARIPPLRTAQEKTQRSWKIASEWVVGATVLIAIAGITALAYLRG